jgi:hypothetical protein
MEISMQPIDYHGYTLTPVYQSINDRLTEQIIHFWQRNNAIPDPAERRRRVADVVYTIHTASGELVGVSTVYVSKLQGDGPSYFYRMFIQAEHRQPGMMRHITNATRDLLQGLRIPNKPGGMIIITENQKLMRPGLRRMLQRHGYRYLGQTPQQLDVWKAVF